MEQMVFIIIHDEFLEVFPRDLIFTFYDAIVLRNSEKLKFFSKKKTGMKAFFKEKSLIEIFFEEKNWNESFFQRKKLNQTPFENQLDLIRRKAPDEPFQIDE
eukprot:TRINITY_DN5734_c0_g3_i2.p5 TRINITY_DN5734_c0_g3~~TRINITY_DN5734_c0_g3_i2.p5  ORF type:complete len:102 (-),score=5.41 TRINITY_DN5734_c0_g3_i2:736-1041(-)